jgi:diadenosine tetraphosphate (Ap4A) HIT family hydrolase
MNNSRYVWLILVPRINDLREVHELSEADQQQLLRESSWVSQQLANTFKADKMNVANLGNVVAQLHWHIIVRHKNDDDWPAPIWGRQPSIAYNHDQADQRLNQLRQVLSNNSKTPLTC